MPAFMTGLVDSLNKGLQDRLQERRAQRQAEQQQALQLQSQQLLFEQQQRQSETAMANKFSMEDKFAPQIAASAKRSAELERQIKEDMSRLPKVENPEYLAAMQENDFNKMYALAAADPKLMPHMEKWWHMVGKHSQMISGAVEKESRIQEKKTEGFAAREAIKEKRAGKPGVAGKASSSPKEGRLTEVQRAQIRDIDNQLNLARRQLGKEMTEMKEPDPQKIKDAQDRIKNLEADRRRIIKPPTGEVSQSVSNFATILKQLREERAAYSKAREGK